MSVTPKARPAIAIYFQLFVLLSRCWYSSFSVVLTGSFLTSFFIVEGGMSVGNGSFDPICGAPPPPSIILLSCPTLTEDRGIC